MQKKYTDKYLPYPVKSELPIFILIVVMSIILWFLLILSFGGIYYAILVLLFLYLSRMISHAYIRGSAVKLGPEQFPDLYKQVLDLSEKVGLRKAPEAYIMQSGGILNAFVAKFISTNLLVLYTDFLDACDGDKPAQDMIIGHELGHIKERHLNWFHPVLIALFFPLIGHAYRRSQELTCDRYGLFCAGEMQGAIAGLTILACGPKRYRDVNVKRYVRQTHQFRTGFMIFARWLMPSPPLTFRLVALDPTLLKEHPGQAAGIIKACFILLIVCATPFGLNYVTRYIYKIIRPAIFRVIEEFRPKEENFDLFKDADYDINRIDRDFNEIDKAIQDYYAKHGKLPSDNDGTIATVWKHTRSGILEPKDPYDGRSYGYRIVDDRYYIYSVGPDTILHSEDDIYFDPEGSQVTLEREQ
ncbi:MAG: M48 family metallopeptidase [Candidatus Omnitrophica bacterium]|nr:M48 family metallopeptidase [Candidatus Omnitrophota bacterium]